MSKDLETWLISSFESGCSVEIKITVCGKSIVGELMNLSDNSMKYLFYQNETEFKIFMERLEELICSRFVVQ